MQMKKLLSTSTYLFLIFYLCYAISPLSYSVADSQLKRTGGEAAKATKTIRLFVIDSLLSDLLLQEDEDSDGLDDESTLILLQKKRAILSSGNIIARPASHTVLYHEIRPILDIVSYKQQLPDREFNCPNGFELIHSGISPPSA